MKALLLTAALLSAASPAFAKGGGHGSIPVTHIPSATSSEHAGVVASHSGPLGLGHIVLHGYKAPPSQTNGGAWLPIKPGPSKPDVWKPIKSPYGMNTKL